MGAFWFIVIGIAVYMIIYALEWSWNYVEVSPMVLDEQKRTEIAGLTEKLKAIEPSSDRQRQTRIAFAALMEEGKELEVRMLTAQSGAEFSPMGLQVNDWVERTKCAFIEAGLHTDASAFAHSGERPSDEQMKAIPFYLKKQVWKHYDIARITAYLAKLQEIIERRNL